MSGVTFTRKQLTRGTRLVRQAILEPLQAIATALGTGTLGTANMATPMAPFRVTLHVPAIDAELFLAWTRPGDTSLCIPFCIPPLQEDFLTSGVLGSNAPVPVLDEFQFSFDQRDEACTITDRSNNAVADAGRIDWDAPAETYDCKVALLEHRQWYFDTAQPYAPDREVFSVEVPGLATLSRINRVNPFVLSGLQRVMNPYRTYMVSLEMPNLYAGLNAGHALPALTLSFRFRSPLVRSDRSCQNLPTFTTGFGSYTLTNPAIGAIIADPPINGNAKVLDNALRDRLAGGFGLDGVPPVREQLQEEAAYTVMAIPMWANFGSRRCTSDPVTLLAQLGPGNCNSDNYFDQVQIPISRPFFLHHAFAMVNRCGPRTVTLQTSVAPLSDTFLHEVGIGLVTGIKGDELAYQQLAEISVNRNTKTAVTVDRLNPSPNQQMTTGFEPWCWDVLALPLLGAGSPQAGVGYYAQGQPIFCGRTSQSGQPRTNINNLVPGTKGLETYLEFRWKIYDPLGLAFTGAVPPGASVTQEDTFVGYGGHWIILVGKTPVTTAGHQGEAGILI